ncbi:unnamed protein product [Macrosiphum euphorbiae]|uniref:Uncharacterized protein n=1 Tax=Macrosiphum euphorbiae TaxID=13131 RepID=A0AAV0XA90_9HEMI|nr:unnamed protein product [Macrosiphum euphorbiae]
MHGVLHPQGNAFTDISMMEPRTGYFCADGIWMESTKDRQRRCCKDFVRKVQKKICEQIFNFMKMRLRIKEFNIDNPCND